VEAQNREQRGRSNDSKATEVLTEWLKGHESKTSSLNGCVEEGELRPRKDKLRERLKRLKHQAINERKVFVSPGTLVGLHLVN
jgi:hypothetical protein